MEKKSKILILLFLPILVKAQGLQLDYPRIGNNSLEKFPTLPEYIGWLYGFSIVIASFIALWSLVVGGYTYFASVGSPSKISQAKDQIYYSFLGLIILLSSWLILNSINPGLTKLEISTKMIDVPITKPEEIKANQSEYLVLPLGQMIEHNFYSKEAMNKFKTQGQNIVNLETEIQTLQTLAKNLNTEIQNCKCGTPDCGIDCPCNGECLGIYCDKDEIENFSIKLKNQIRVVNGSLEKLATSQYITKQMETMGTIMSLSHNKNVDSYYTFLAGRNLIADAKLELVETTDPFPNLDSYWQNNKADPLTFYINRSSNKRLINEIYEDTLGNY